MDGAEFVAGVKESVRNGAVRTLLRVLRRTPGPKTGTEDQQFHSFFSRLSEEDKVMFECILGRLADYCTFNFLCVLDGAAASEARSTKGELILRYVNEATGEDVTLTPPDAQDLHDFYHG